MKENSIHIGSNAKYEQVYIRGSFAVYRRSLDGLVSFIVAKIPGDVRAGDPPAVPTSVLESFTSEPEATAALNKWADAPVEVPFPKKRKEAIELCHNVVRPKLRKVGPGQLDLPLSE